MPGKKDNKKIKFYPEDCNADDFKSLEAKKILYKLRRNHKPICFDGLANAIISQDDQELKYKILRFNVKKCTDPAKCAPLNEIDKFVNNLNVMQTGIFNRPMLDDVNSQKPFYKEH